MEEKIDYNDSKKRFKLYKAGKAWLIAGTVFLTLIGANLAANADSTTTDTGNNSVQNTQTVPNNQDITSADADQNNVTPISSKADDKNQTETTKGTDETVNEPINGDSNAVESNSTTTIDDISSKSDKDKDDVTTIAQADSNNQNSTSLNTDNINKDKNVSTETSTNNHDDSVKSDSSTPTDNAKPDGWNADHTQYTQDGQLVTGVQNIDGTYYDFDENHNLVKNNYVQSQWGDWYMFGDNGQIATKVTPWSGTYYYFDPLTYLRVDNNYVQSQWGDWYMFGDNGQIATKVIPWSGTYYYFDPLTYLRVDNNYVQSQWGTWYMFGNDGRIVVGLADWTGAKYYFDPSTYLKVTNAWENIGYGSAYFDGNGQMDSINLFHQWYSQLNQGMPEGCEGASLQIAASVLGRYYNLADIYNTIGYGWNLTPYNGFYGNPWGGSSYKVQTVFASAMANKLAGMVSGIQDLTGAGTVIDELRNGHAVVTWANIDWNLYNQNDFHVMSIVGYSNGQFLISDPYAYSQKEYWIPTSTWAYVNANTQAVGWNTPRSMNLVIN
ncbi:C39 family peptidase [Fructilactobacillus sanfranciscensis]|uniref:C39 family peptidase n=1 Tax=Fructilactobacillus sanfranciscensis TaxID=1625 RepID=UPI0023AA7A33|nr:C39 family peptidase [Fructilactobacillus sanfranciscensis]WED57312.1 C39 family peptidase [Fructilactobacillus sanfranciscensis]